MTMTGLQVFDTTVQKTNEFVNGVAAELGWEDKHRAFQGLRITLHALRDRLTVNEVANLGSQMPMLLAGFYYEDWKPETNPAKERSKEEFLGQIRDYFQNVDSNIDSERVVRAVFTVLSRQVTQGEIEDIVQMMPSELKEFWPQTVRS